MDILIKALQLILSLSILVVLHELGHFLPAKWFKTKVEKFYLFFDAGFSLFKKKIGETEYGVGWLPLGGYVKIAGMIDESMDKDFLEREPEPWEFRSKPAWQRLVIMLGGVTVNIILGYLIFSMMAWAWGTSYVPNSAVKDGIFVDSLGYEMGLRTGDKILKIGDKDFEKFNPGLLLRGVIIDDARSITVERNGAETVIPIDEKYVQILTGEGKDEFLFDARTPAKLAYIKPKGPADQAGLQADDIIVNAGNAPIKFYDELLFLLRDKKINPLPISYTRNGQLFETIVHLDENGKMGISGYRAQDVFQIEKETYNLVESIGAGIRQGNGFITDQIKAFGQIFKGKIKAKDSLGSFLSIGNMFPSTWNWKIFWNMTAMLSLILGILNLLPIPGLDGGHVVFLIWEVITGRKASDKVVEYATMVGFVILILLMVFALGNDIRRFWPF